MLGRLSPSMCLWSAIKKRGTEETKATVYRLRKLQKCQYMYTTSADGNLGSGIGAIVIVHMWQWGSREKGLSRVPGHAFLA